MPQTVTKTVGPGRDFETLADFAAALPADLTAVDEAWVAELSPDATDPGGAVIAALSDTTRFVTLTAAAGAAPGAVRDPLLDPLTPGMPLGARVSAASGDAIRVEGAGTRLAVTRLAITVAAGSALGDDGDGRIVRAEDCLIDADGAAPAAVLRGTDALARNLVVVKRGAGDGLTLAGGAAAEGCTLFKPAAVVAEGTGVATAGSGAEIRSSAAFGFARAFSQDVAATESLASDQINLIPAPTDFGDPYWTPVGGASLIAGQTRATPFGVDLQRLESNGNSFARFQGAALHDLAPGARFAFSALVAEPSVVVSALLIFSDVATPEMRVTWTDSPPSVVVLGQGGALSAVEGRLDDLGGDLWRLELTVENASAAAITVQPYFYVTRSPLNDGVEGGMFGGATMAGPGHLGTGFVGPDATPGTGAIPGVDPAAALTSVDSVGPDLRPLGGGPLEGAGTLAGADFYSRIRVAPDTIGAVTLNPLDPDAPEDLSQGHTITATAVLAAADFASADDRRQAHPGSPERIIPV